MARPRKSLIDYATLDKLLLEGKSGKDCAAFFGCSEPAISRARKYIKTHVIRTVGLEKAGAVVQGHLNILEQTRRINQVINQELDAAVADVNAARADGKDPRQIQEIVVKLAAEVRRQCETYLQMAEAWRDFKEYEEFKNEIMDLVAKLPKEYRIEFEDKVKQKGLLRGSLQLDPR